MPYNMAALATHGLPATFLSGVPPVKAECLPFSQVPHTAPLFTDFLSYAPRVQPFYPRSPRFADWVRDEARQLRYDDVRRASVASILERQNRAWGASEKTLANIARLRNGAFAAITGQQVGLFGGPVFSIFKALTAVKLAEQASSAGVDAVPVFWLATEDHDLAEINHVSLLGPRFSLSRLQTASHGAPDAQVGTIHFGHEIEPVVRSAAELLGDSEAIALLRDSYRVGESFGGAFARLFSRWFADWGVILLDPADPEFHAIAAPVFRAAVEHSAELDRALLARGRELEAAGYHQQVKVTASSTLLFVQRNGTRTALHRRSNGSSGEYIVGEDKISQAELLRRLDTAPQEFSANVLLRPVMQDYLLPTLAYTGGPAEVAYFAQCAVVYEQLLGRITPVIPRFSATLIEAKLASILDRYHLGLTDLFHGLDPLRERLATHNLPQDVQSAFDQAESALRQSLTGIRDSLARLDSTLVDAASRAASKMHYQINRLRARAGRAELQRSEILSRHAELLINTLFPNHAPQEREIGALYFMARYGPDLLHTLYDSLHPECLEHQVIRL